MMRKLTPLFYSCVIMITPPIALSFLDQIDHWAELLMLLSTAISLPIALLISNHKIANYAFFISMFIGCFVWLAVLLLPLFVLRFQKIWFYAFQLAYSSLNAWLGIMIIGSKHC